MDPEPRNAATRRILEGVATWSDPETAAAAWDEFHSEDFVREDRRRVTHAPDADREDHLRGLLLWFDLLDGRPTFGFETIAVRGDRLALVLAWTRYANGTSREALSVVEFDPEVRQATRHVNFEPDDLEAATAELDRIHASLSSEAE